MKLTLIAFMFPVIIALLTLSECSTEAREQPVEENLARLKVVQFVPGTEDYSVWEVME